MTETNGKKWDAKTVIIAALLALIPVVAGITYNITTLALAHDNTDIKELSVKVDDINSRLIRIETKVDRL